LNGSGYRKPKGSRSLRFPPDDHDGQVVGPWSAGAEFFQVLQGRGKEGLGRESRVPFEQIGKARGAVLFAGGVEGFRQPVGIENQAVAFVEREFLGGIGGLAGNAERQAGGLNRRRSTGVDVERQAVAGVADLDFTAMSDSAADDGGKIRERDAVAENPVGSRQQLAGRMGGGSQAAKDGVQLGHEHGGGHAFAGHVSDEEARALFTGDPIAVIAAHRTGGLVMIGHSPTIGGQLGLGKKSSLNLKGQVEVALQGALLGRRQVIETISAERINEKPIGFNRIVTSLANPKRSGLHSLQGGVHFAQQLADGLRIGNSWNSGVQTFPSLEQLRPQGGVSNGVRELSRLHVKLFHRYLPLMRKPKEMLALLNISIYIEVEERQEGFDMAIRCPAVEKKEARAFL
jgi:hypothetical protein